MRQHFKGVVWPCGKAENSGQQIHKYAVIGLLVTDKAIPELEKAPPIENPEPFHSDTVIVIDAGSPGLAEILQNLPKRNANRPVSDATNVLEVLREI